MRDWLALLALLASATTAAAQAPMKGLAPSTIASVARTRTIDLRVSQQQGDIRPLPLIRGMMFQQGLAANAFVGVGLANIYGRAKAAPSQRTSDRPARSRKPAVSFVLKF